MATDSCLLAARVQAPAQAAFVRERIRALRRLYAVGGALPTARVEVVAGGHVIVASLPWESTTPGPAAERGADWSWGESTRVAVPTDELPAAAEDRVGVAFAVAGDGVHIVSGAGGPTTLYRAAADGISVWSTHAIAAAWLAFGEVRLDFERLPELMAFDFVGGSGTLIRGVDAMPPAAKVTIDADRVVEACYSTSAQRWQPVPERDAQLLAEEAFVSSLARRLVDERAAAVALTGGLDSAVVALALVEAGIRFATFTWGHPNWPDPQGASALADRLGVAHATHPGEALSEHEAATLLRRQAIFADGVAALTFGTRIWPSDASAFAIGMGGETGRCFYYGRHNVERCARPADRQLLDALVVEKRLAGASPDVIAAAREGAARWIEIARASGREGWSLLDVAYAEQRVAHWGRSQYEPIGQAIVPAFTAPRVARLLASLSLRERLESGFHRGFLARRGEPRELPPRSLARRLAPAFVRRAASRVRSHQQPEVDPVDELLAAAWREQPQLRSWLAEDVLGRSELAAVMGEEWTSRIRTGFLEGRRRAVERAQLAAGVFVAQDELRRLQLPMAATAPDMPRASA